MPEELQEIDVRLNADLEASPVLSSDFFTPQQRRFIGIGSEDIVPASTDQSTQTRKETIKTHLRYATDRFRGTQPDLDVVVPGTSSKPRIFPHRLAYVCLDNEIVPVGDELDAVDLTPKEALVLKSLAVSETVLAAAKRAVMPHSTVARVILPQIREKMGVSTNPGVMGKSYRMRLFVPRPVEPSTRETGASGLIVH
jgi:hypothetical protein